MRCREAEFASQARAAVPISSAAAWARRVPAPRAGGRRALLRFAWVERRTGAAWLALQGSGRSLCTPFSARPKQARLHAGKISLSPIKTGRILPKRSCRRQTASSRSHAAPLAPSRHGCANIRQTWLDRFHTAAKISIKSEPFIRIKTAENTPCADGEAHKTLCPPFSRLPGNKPACARKDFACRRAGFPSSLV